jgi:toxin CcdB
MRQYDVVRLKGGELAVIVQSDLLDGFLTRVIVPLIPASELVPTPLLHPCLRLGRRELVLAMEQILAVRLADIEKVIGSARGLEYEIQRAYDMVLAGI